MQFRFALAAVAATLVMGAGAAHAGNTNQSFEDGLKNSWTTPSYRFFGDRDWHHNSKPHGWGGWGGNGNGHGGGIGVSPIPEPQTYAILLAGLVAVATLARRRSKPQA